MWDLNNWIDGAKDIATHHGAAFLAFNVGAITSLNAFKNRVDQLIQDIHETPKAKGTDRLYVPGEMEWEKRRESLANGISLPPDVVESLQATAKELGMTAAWLFS
jgi:LDH2 family malate/lactate/ureidoglycolate dehydrogenase